MTYMAAVIWARAREIQMPASALPQARLQQGTWASMLWSESQPGGCLGVRGVGIGEQKHSSPPDPQPQVSHPQLSVRYSIFRLHKEDSCL